MRLLAILLTIVSLASVAQPKQVTESVQLNGQTNLDLEFTFADEIVFKTWNKNEVRVEVEVEINDGKYNDIFTLESSTSSSTVYIEMDEDMWDKIDRDDRWDNCTWRTNIDYTVYLPKQMEVEASTISGDYTFEYFGTPLRLKTISGVIDMTVPTQSGLDFSAKTISGEVYTDIEIEFPYGKDGLRQIVGQNFKGRIGRGGNESRFETISGNIYLRKG